MAPEELKYTPDHEWVARSGADTVRVGITDYAQAQLGDVVFVQLPDVGMTFSKGQPVGEIESTKSVSDVFAPADGEVTARNDDLDAEPERINANPYDEGWMFELRLADAGALDGLLTADEYRKLTEQE